MTAGSTYTTEDFRVWVMIPNEIRDWVVVDDIPQWTETHRLVPRRFTRALGSKGNATFRLVRATITGDDGVPVVDTISYAPGMYICITRGDTIPVLAQDWVGKIESIDETLLADGADSIGTVRARELGATLYDMQLSGWRRQAGTSVDGVAMDRPPTANITYKGGVIWGNAALTENADAFMFADDFDDLEGEDGRWNPIRLINHALAYALPGGAPDIDVFDNTDGALEAITDEVWEIDGVSFGQFLDLVVPAARGFAWSIVALGTGWAIRLFGTNSELATPENITLGDWCAGAELQRFQPYDRVVVRGQPIVWCGTASIASGTLRKGWTQTLEDEFLIASGATTEDEAQVFRRQEKYGDVFEKFELAPHSTGYIQADIASGTGATAGKLCMEVSYGSGELAFTDIYERGPDYPSARILNWTPIPIDYPETGWNESVDVKYRDPKVWPVVLPGDGTAAYADISVAQTESDSPGATPQIKTDDRSPSIRVTFQYPEQLAYDSDGETIEQPSSGTTGLSAIDNRIQAGDDRGYHVGTMQVTFAIESGQRLELHEDRTGTILPRRVLTVDRKDFGCYVLRRGTRYGTTNTQRTTAEVVIRNDYPKAETLLAQLTAWAFQDRSSATIAFYGSENAPWAVVGALLGVMTYGDAQTRTLNTVVSSVSCDCSNARWTVTTDLPVMPAGASVSGGGVSQTIGGTQHKAIEKLRAQVDTIKREDQGRIIVAGTPLAGGGGGSTTFTGNYDVLASPAIYQKSLVTYDASSGYWRAAMYYERADAIVLSADGGVATMSTLRSGVDVSLSSLTAGAVYYRALSGHELTTTRPHSRVVPILYAKTTGVAAIIYDCASAPTGVFVTEEIGAGGLYGYVDLIATPITYDPTYSDDDDLGAATGKYSGSLPFFEPMTFGFDVVMAGFSASSSVFGSLIIRGRGFVRPTLATGTPEYNVYGTISSSATRHSLGSGPTLTVGTTPMVKRFGSIGVSTGSTTTFFTAGGNTPGLRMGITGAPLSFAVRVWNPTDSEFRGALHGSMWVRRDWNQQHDWIPDDLPVE